jgi:hypothetical protein
VYQIEAKNARADADKIKTSDEKYTEKKAAADENITKKYADAEALLKRALTIAEKSLGKESIDLLPRLTTLVDFYDAQDLERGYVRMEDRKGVMQDIPLVAISVGIASTAKRHFAHYGEAVAVATEMKSFAKREPGSSYAVDRRTET